MADRESEMVFDVDANAQKNSASAAKSRILMGVAAGALVSLVGTVLWILFVQKLLVPWMSIIIAAGAAFTIQKVSRSDNFLLGFAGALFAALSSLVGNLFTILSMFSRAYGWTLAESLKKVDLFGAIKPFGAPTRPIDTAMYVAAVLLGFFLAYEHRSKFALPPD